MRVATVFFVSIACCVCFAADEGPWPFPELRYRRHFVVDPVKGLSRQTGLVRFSTGNAIDPEKPDVRVVAVSGRVPCRVLQVGPGSLCRVAFRVAPRIKDYYVFYGPGKAKPRAAEWKPEAGLLLETRRFNGGGLNKYDELQKVVRESGPSFGMNVVTQVFHGHNPFGPSDNYVSIYAGDLRIAKGGNYVFATTSDDASAMCVDGKVVAKKYGYGGAVRDARFMGKPIRLSPGRHSFEYYHVEVGGGQSAVAAWEPPGGKWGVIPREAFGPVLEGRRAAYVVRGQAVAPDVVAVNSGEVIFRGKQMTRVSFRNATLHPNVFQFKPQWDFGDGTSSQTINPEHIYFEFGEYDVSLTLTRGGKSYTARHTVVVDEGWERQTVRNNDNRRQYYGIMKRYQFAKMKLSHIDRAMDVFEDLDAHKQILKASGVVVRRGDEAADPLYLRHCLLYAEALCRERDLRNNRPKEKAEDGTEDEYAGIDLVAAALSALTEAENRLQKPEHKVKAALKKGDVYFYYVRDLEKAREEYERILTVYRRAEAADVRVAQIRLGDYFRKKGKTDAARKAYEKADEMAGPDRPYAKDAARVGALQESAENYLRRGELTAARKQLDLWEWEHPEEKLEGRSSLLRAELALKEKKHEEALTQLQDLVTGNRDCPLAPEALLRIASIRMELGDHEEALAACERISADYPASLLKEDAGFLSCECLVNGKKYESALARLQELLAAYPDSPHRPRAMLAMGDCLRELGRAEKANETWHELVEKFPDSEERKAAEERLKE